jgi:HK97 family phage major capsid protein
VAIPQIKSVAELEALQKDPAQFTQYISEVVSEQMGTVASDAIKSAVERGLAKAKLPGRVAQSDEAVSGTAIAEILGQQKSADKWRTWGKLSPASKSYGSPRGDYHSFGQYLTDLYEARGGGVASSRLKAAFAEGSGSSGGFLIPEEYRAQLMALALEGARFRPLAMTIPMTSMTLRMPYIRDVSHVSSVFGGVVANWEAEAQTIAESEPTFAQMELMARKLTAYTVVSNEVMADSAIGLEAILQQRFPPAIRFFEERAFWKGKGAGQPLGILNAPATLNVPRTTAGAITYEDIVALDSHILPMSAENVVWFANPSTKSALYTMALSVGTGGGPVFINSFAGGAANTPPATIFGRPLVFTEHLPALGTTGDLVAVDLSYYIIGDRQDLSMEASPHVRFTSDQTVYRWVERLDGRPWLDASLLLEDGSTTVSPFVALQ